MARAVDRIPNRKPALFLEDGRWVGLRSVWAVFVFEHLDTISLQLAALQVLMKYIRICKQADLACMAVSFPQIAASAARLSSLRTEWRSCRC